MHRLSVFFFFFFNDTATTEIYTLSLHDALPISTEAPAGFDTPTLSQNQGSESISNGIAEPRGDTFALDQQKLEEAHDVNSGLRSEEHTSELQSPCNLVCRLLLEKKKIYTMKRLY